MTKHLIFRISPRTGNSGTPWDPMSEEGNTILPYCTSMYDSYGSGMNVLGCLGKFGGRWRFSRFPEYEKHISKSGNKNGGEIIRKGAASGRIRTDTCSWLNMLMTGGGNSNIFIFIP